MVSTRKRCTSSAASYRSTAAYRSAPSHRKPCAASPNANGIRCIVWMTSTRKRGTSLPRHIDLQRRIDLLQRIELRRRVGKLARCHRLHIERVAPRLENIAQYRIGKIAARLQWSQIQNTVWVARGGYRKHRMVSAAADRKHCTTPNAIRCPRTSPSDNQLRLLYTLHPLHFLVYPSTAGGRFDRTTRAPRLPGSGGCNSVVECQLPKLDVAGSTPVARSTNSLQLNFGR